MSISGRVIKITHFGSFDKIHLYNVYKYYKLTNYKWESYLQGQMSLRNRNLRLVNSMA